MGTGNLKTPDGYALHTRERVKLLYDAESVPAECLEWFETLPSILSSRPAEKSRSRHLGSVWALEPPDGIPHVLVARQHVHGGLFGAMIGRCRTLFLDPAPMTDELRIASHLRRRGVPTSHPIALRFENRFGPFFSALLVSERIPDAHNLLEVSRKTLGGEWEMPASSRGILIEKLARSIAAMHESRVDHGDLNLKNVLVQARDDVIDEVYIIDFKKASLREAPVPPEKGVSNMERLWRSVRKWPESAGLFRSEDRTKLLELYRGARRQNQVK